MNPPLPLEISTLEPPSPLEFPVTFCGGGDGYILEPHNFVLIKLFNNMLFREKSAIMTPSNFF